MPHRTPEPLFNFQRAPSLHGDCGAGSGGQKCIGAPPDVRSGSPATRRRTASGAAHGGAPASCASADDPPPGGRRRRTGNAAADGELSAAQEVSRLDAVITAERLYAPGRLLHLRRPLRADAAPARARTSSANGDLNAWPPTCAVPAVHGSSGATADGGGCAGDAGADLDDMFLVDGDPMDARFEFIAVRSTWVTDHSLVAMMRALKAASRREP